MAPRAGLLLNPPDRAYSCRDSNPRRGKVQWQVTGFAVSVCQGNFGNDFAYARLKLFEKIIPVNLVLQLPSNDSRVALHKP